MPLISAKTIGSILILILASAAPFALAKESPNLKLWWKMGGHTISDQQTKARVFGTRIYASLHRPLTDSLSAEATVRGTFEGGANTSLVLKEFSPRRELKLKEARLDWRAASFLSLRGGSLFHKDSPLLLKPSNPFPALEQDFAWKMGKSKLSLRLRQSLPDNKGAVFDRAGSVEQRTPSLFIETLEYAFKGKSLATSLSGSFFAFNHPSSATAETSQYMGNSVVDGEDDETARFRYKHAGRLFKGKLKFPLGGRWKLSLQIHYLQNAHAPEKRNTGHLTKIGLADEHHSFYVEAFSNQSDSSIGLYNHKSYRHNNRKGAGFGAKFRSPSSNTVWNFSYRKAEVLDDKIAPALWQSDSTVVSFSLQQAAPSIVNF